MLLEVFVILEALAIIMLLITMSRSADYKGVILSFLALMFFVFLAFVSFNLQTENCQNILQNITTSGDVHSLAYSYSCTVNEFVDSNLSWLNMGLAFISFMYGLGIIFIKKWVM